jgi:hypothetical protein
MTATSRRWGGVVAVTVASALVLLAFRGSLPPDVATHWGPSGRPDGWMPFAALVTFQTVVVFAVGALSVRGRRLNAPVLAFELAMLVLVDALILWANWHAVSWQEARRVPVVLALGAVAVALGVAALVRRLRPPVRDLTGPPPDALRLAAGERVVWTGTARNVVLLALAAASAVVAAAVAATARPAAMAGPALVGVCAAAFGQVRVVVSETGVRVPIGPWRRPVLKVPMARIVAARVGTHTAPSWGYRGSRRVFGRAVVAVRRGPTLELTLTDGSTLSVTVDDAATAADVVNGLAARATAGAASG